jgi:predicted type IV restriction endonuclease
MSSTFDDAFGVVQSLARAFEANQLHYLSSSYQESDVRKDFIDEFLIALGWDINHDWQRKFESLDRQIDTLDYELYCLTDEEIKL